MFATWRKPDFGTVWKVEIPDQIITGAQHWWKLPRGSTAKTLLVTLERKRLNSQEHALNRQIAVMKDIVIECCRTSLQVRMAEWSKALRSKYLIQL